MKNRYTIPIYGINGKRNNQTIKNAIELLNGKYVVDFEFMSEQDRIKTLECIASLADIYFNMEEN